MRSAATRPSIMSLGATTSAPAFAWTTAIFASTSSVASLSTSISPPRRLRRMPQWPWSVYSSTHTSVMTRRSGAALFISATARGTGPSGSSAEEPLASFFSGKPKRRAPPTPLATISFAWAAAMETGSWKIPGIVEMGFGSRKLALKNSG